jgi:hypothetical protein
MIECVFTIDYEIYGNGEGSLTELVYEPTDKLIKIFEKVGASFVCFVEAAEFQRIEEGRTDPAIDDVRRQIQQLHQRGFEIGLHLHPQWFNADYQNGRWWLDYSEYNLCVLSRERMTQMMGSAIGYLRKILDLPGFTPLSYRGGNWLFQPTRIAAGVLSEHGIKIDSSVFKGGLQHEYQLDYRPALRNGDFWTFADDVNVPDPDGGLLEIPIYSELVPLWKLFTRKRLEFSGRGASSGRHRRKSFARVRDFLRPYHPLKFDFCRMTLSELISMMDRVIANDRKQPELFKPMIAIGHSKDLLDWKTVEGFLSYLKSREITVSTLNQIYQKCLSDARGGDFQQSRSPRSDLAILKSHSSEAQPEQIL